MVIVAALTGICAVSVPAGAQTGSGCANATTQAGSISTGELAASTRCLINAERSALGLTSLGSASPLTKAANRQLSDMLSNGHIDHIGTDGSTHVSRDKDSGYISKKLKKWTVGEILAYGSDAASTPAAVVTAWMNSPTHRRVIVHAPFRQVAIAVGKGTAAAGGANAPNSATYVAEFGVKKNK